VLHSPQRSGLSLMIVLPKKVRKRAEHSASPPPSPHPYFAFSCVHIGEISDKRARRKAAIAYDVSG
jgi:hypothetical protein